MEREYDQREALYAAGRLGGGSAIGGSVGVDHAGLMRDVAAPLNVERDLRHVIARINESIGNAASSRDRVGEIADRVKGSRPEADGKPGLASGGSGDIGEIHSLLDGLTNVLDGLSSNIRRIESL